MTEKTKSEYILEFLKTEGYRPEKDQDADIVFKKEGIALIFLIDEKDSAFYHLMLPGVHIIEKKEEMPLALMAANEANKKSKVAKVFIQGDRVHVTAESLLPNPDMLKDIFDRLFSTLDNAAKNFATEFTELTEKAKES